MPHGAAIVLVLTGGYPRPRGVDYLTPPGTQRSSNTHTHARLTGAGRGCMLGSCGATTHAAPHATRLCGRHVEACGLRWTPHLVSSLNVTNIASPRGPVLLVASSMSSQITSKPHLHTSDTCWRQHVHAECQTRTCTTTHGGHNRRRTFWISNLNVFPTLDQISAFREMRGIGLELWIRSHKRVRRPSLSLGAAPGPFGHAV